MCALNMIRLHPRGPRSHLCCDCALQWLVVGAAAPAATPPAATFPNRLRSIVIIAQACQVLAFTVPRRIWVDPCRTAERWGR